MSQPAALQELLAGAVAAARAAGASDAEASHVGGTVGFSRFANSYLTQTGLVDEPRTRLRVALGDRIAAVATDALNANALAEAARAAVAIAEHQPATKGFDGFARPGAAAAAARNAFFPATAAMTPGERADAVDRIFVRAAKERLVCAGAFMTAARRLAVVTSAGVAAEHSFTDASLHLIALDGDASGFAGFASGDVSRLDLTAFADEAIATAARSRDAVDVPPGPYDVVLAPTAVAELLEWMALTSFAGTTVLDGTSLLAGRRGEQVCGESITLRDDWQVEHPGAIPIPFDAEGTPRRRVVFIDHGVAGAPVTDRLTARRFGAPESSGHAAPLGDDLAEGPVAAHLVLSPGDATAEELVSRVERGLYVTRFHYVNGFLDTRRATMTGMTRDGTFLIENGRLGRAVTNLRFTESVLDAFSRVGGISRDLVAARTHLSHLAPYLCPTLLLRQFRFTGKSR